MNSLRPQSDSIVERIALASLVLLAFVLRFYHLGDLSLSNDELSAWFRADVSSFGQLIKESIAPDGHPAGVQVFLYWFKPIIGDSVFLLRMPFATMGALSVLILYKIGRIHFSFATSFTAASLLGIACFPLLHSLIARPYSPGLFFSLLFALSCSKLVNGRKLWSILYCLSFAAAFYCHYFSALQVAVIAISAFLLGHVGIKRLVMLNTIAVALILPHFFVTLDQIALGGLQWIEPPKLNLLLDFLWLSLNESHILVTLLLCSALFGLFVVRRSVSHKQMAVYAFWALSPFLIGWAYSLLGSPVLRDACLLFSLPFMYLLVAHLMNPPRWIAFFMPVVLCFDSVIQKDFYQADHFGNFKKMAAKIDQWNREFPSDTAQLFVNVNNPDYLNFYLQKLPTEEANSLVITGNHIDYKSGFKQLKQVLSAQESDYFISGYCHKLTDLSYRRLVEQHYPVQIDQWRSFNTALELHRKEFDSSALIRKAELVPSKNKSSHFVWLEPTPAPDDSIAHAIQTLAHFQMKSDAEFSPAFDSKTKNWSIEKGDFILATCQFDAMSTVRWSNMVITIEQDEKTLIWKQLPLCKAQSGFIDEKASCSGAGKVQFAYQLRENLGSSARLKVFVHSPSTEVFELVKMTVSQYRY